MPGSLVLKFNTYNSTATNHSTATYNSTAASNSTATYNSSCVGVANCLQYTHRQNPLGIECQQGKTAQGGVLDEIISPPVFVCVCMYVCMCVFVF